MKMMSKEEIKDLIYRVEQEFNNELDYDYDYNGRELTDDDLNMIENAISNFASKLNLCVDDDDNHYRSVELRDCWNGEVYTRIMLNYKHSVKEFQDEINRIREEKSEEINKYGDDWSIISENISEDFDWYELDIDTDDDYLEF